MFFCVNADTFPDFGIATGILFLLLWSGDKAEATLAMLYTEDGVEVLFGTVSRASAKQLLQVLLKNCVNLCALKAHRKIQKYLYEFSELHRNVKNNFSFKICLSYIYQKRKKIFRTREGDKNYQDKIILVPDPNTCF